MAPRAELEAALAGDTRFPIDAVRMPELRVKGWAVGMAVKSDDEQLATALSQALATLEQNGTVAKIFAHYGVTLASPDAH
jgi:ABC-type amino acid transport substrate-binding protein